MEEKIIQKKPRPRKLRGWATYSGDEFTFKPTEEGTPSQLNVKTCRGGKLFTTTSEKAPKQVAHLTCPATAADPFGEYVAQLQKLGIKPLAASNLPERLRLMNEGGMEAWLNQTKGRLTYTGSIDLTTTRNWQADLMRQMQLIVRRLPAEEKFRSTVSKLEKGRRAAYV